MRAACLDLGCAAGALGVGLKRRGAEVVGIELDPSYAEAAARRLDRVVEGDVAEALRHDDLDRFFGWLARTPLRELFAFQYLLRCEWA